jgi:nitric oxide reductase NorD protein
VIEPDRRASLLTATLAGRWVELRSTGHPRAFATQDAIFIPQYVIGTPDERRTLLVQASLLGANSLDVAAAARLSGTLARRYLAIEVPRAVQERSAVLNRLPEMVGLPASARASSAEESLRTAKTRLRIEEPPDWFGDIAPRRVVNRLSGPVGDPPAGSTLPDAGDDGEDSDGTRAAQMVNALLQLLEQSGVDGGASRLIRRFALVGHRRTGSGGAGRPSKGMLASGKLRSGTAPDGRSQATGTPPDHTDGPASSDSTLRYPEWDEHRSTYRPNWCHVVEREVEITAALNKAPASDAVLRRSVARVSLDRMATRRQPHGPDVDVDAAISAIATRAATGHADDSLYIDGRPRRPDLNAIVLLDVSGSAGTSDRGAHTHRLQQHLAEGIVDALHAAGCQVASMAFRSSGRRQVEALSIKRFGAPWDDDARRRLRGLEPAGYTRLGAAIRHSTAVLTRRRGAARRLLLVVSDGIPFDAGYEGSYAEADVRRAILEARRSGVACIGIAVGQRVPFDRLDGLYGAGAVIRARELSDLRGELGPVIRVALRAARRRATRPVDPTRRAS